MRKDACPLRAAIAEFVVTFLLWKELTAQGTSGALVRSLDAAWRTRHAVTAIDPQDTWRGRQDDHGATSSFSATWVRTSPPAPSLARSPDTWLRLDRTMAMTSPPTGNGATRKMYCGPVRVGKMPSGKTAARLNA